MSMHNQDDKTELKYALMFHGLPHNKPSQLADAFRQGYAHRDTYIAELEAQLAKRVTVKPLVFTVYSEGMMYLGARPIFFGKAYSVRKWGSTWTAFLDETAIGVGRTEYKDAIADVQSYHDQRIRSALTLVDPWSSDMDAAPNDGTPHIRGLWVYCTQTGERLYWQADSGFIDDNGNFATSDGDNFGWSSHDYTHWTPLPTPPVTIDWGFTDLTVQVPKSVEHAKLMILVAENYLEWNEPKKR